MRMDPAAVTTITREFIGSPGARIWPFVESTIRNALVDALVMDAVRMARAVDNESPITPSDLCAFRAAIVAKLAAGIPRGSSGRLHFTIES